MEIGFNFKDSVCLSDLLLLVKLDDYLEEVQMIRDLIRKTCMLFILSWQAKLNGLPDAEWCSFQSRRFLGYIILFPKVAAEVKYVLFNSEFWPDVGPIRILEALSKDYLYCAETLTLLCNLTRIDGVAEDLDEHTSFVANIKQKFYGYCRKLDLNASKLSGLLMQLLVNLSRISTFSE